MLKSVHCCGVAILSLLGLLAAASGGLAEEGAVAHKLAILQSVDRDAARWISVSKAIWDAAETSYREVKSSAMLAAEMRQAGFQVETNLGGVPNSFVASWGSGKPVIAILGEYDALPGLFQEAVAEKKPTGTVGAGHGCGHNLLGAAAAFAAVQARDYARDRRLNGTIRFYGCPAEENGAGKIFLLRAGVFDDCDVALTWHPDDQNSPGMKSTLANQGAYFRYHGKAAHAARAPEKGRSALDAVMIFAHAIELLREHVPQDTRIHYFIRDGGRAANIVPEYSEVRLVARNPDLPTLDGIWARIMKCAEAGALATETTLELADPGGLANVLPNETLATLSEANFKLVGGIRYSPEERAFAERLRSLLPTEGLPPLDSAASVRPIERDYTSWSTDVGNVSWTLPTGEIRVAAFVPGVSAHTWQATACAGMGIGQKAMVVAAKVIALTAVDLLSDPGRVPAARADFERRRAGRVAKPKYPPDAKPWLYPEATK